MRGEKRFRDVVGGETRIAESPCKACLFIKGTNEEKRKSETSYASVHTCACANMSMSIRGNGSLNWKSQTRRPRALFVSWISLDATTIERIRSKTLRADARNPRGREVEDPQRDRAVKSTLRDPERKSAARREKFRRSSDLVKFPRIDHATAWRPWLPENKTPDPNKSRG